MPDGYETGEARLTLRNVFRSALKLVIAAPLEGRNEKTALAPLEPEYRFLRCRC